MAGLLYASELRDPSEWVNQNAQRILDSIKQAGGWNQVFQGPVPMWLHKLRNYFNKEPMTLKLLDPSRTRHWMSEITRHGQLGGRTSGPRTLSGHVYVDESNNIWYQMGPGGSIFHWGNEVEIMQIEAIHTHFFRGQTGIPIFKLICPDGTKGSMETIVVNPLINIKEEVDAMGNVREVAKGESKLGEVGQTVRVRSQDLHVTTMEHQGSYNFAETAVIGRSGHTRFDVETHQKDKFYIDPRDRFTLLKDRIFTEALLSSAGANTKSSVRNMRSTRLDFDEPPMRRSPHGVSNPH
jgi:hypothetical protein